MTEKLGIETYISECFVKCAQVVLSSRIYCASPVVPDKRASRWV